MKKSQRAKKPKSVNNPQSIEKRTWEPWTEKENQIFFNSIVKNSRNWGEISRDVGSKKQEQVRTYYYRVLRKIGRMLQSVHFFLDNRDRMSTLIALVGYWETKCETDYEENSKEFAESIKNSIIRQSKTIEEMRSKRLPSPEKITILLLPKKDETSHQSEFTSNVYITEKSDQTISQIVEYVKKLWEKENGKFRSSYPIRLYPQGIPNHRGYGIEDNDTTILAIYHSMGYPDICKLEYMWSNETLIHSESSMNGDLIDLYDQLAIEEKKSDDGLENDISLEMFVDGYNNGYLFDDYRQSSKNDSIVDQESSSGYNLFHNAFESPNSSFFKSSIFDNNSISEDEKVIDINKPSKNEKQSEIDSFASTANFVPFKKR